MEITSFSIHLYKSQISTLQFCILASDEYVFEVRFLETTTDIKVDEKVSCSISHENETVAYVCSILSWVHILMGLCFNY